MQVRSFRGIRWGLVQIAGRIFMGGFGRRLSGGDSRSYSQLGRMKTLDDEKGTRQNKNVPAWSKSIKY